MIEEVSNYLNQVRHDFTNAEFTEESTEDHPAEQYAKWFEEAVGAQVPDPKAMIICTVNGEGKPSSRVVYARGVSKEGLVFYTNYDSRKAAEVKANPHISVTIYWTELERQIRIEGKVEKLSDKVSDEYFASRPRESQIGAWASKQSRRLKNRRALEDQLEMYRKKFEGKKVPRPENWGGYLIKPDYFEFWQGRPSRLHDRIVYQKSEKEHWDKIRLYP